MHELFMLPFPESLSHSLSRALSLSLSLREGKASNTVEHMLVLYGSNATYSSGSSS